MDTNLNQNKIESVCKIIDGKVITDEKPSALLIRGLYSGFPATFEVIMPFWPFGVTYYLETNLIDDPNKAISGQSASLSIRPRFISGLIGFFGRLLLINPPGQPIGDKAIDSKYILSFNDKDQAERLLFYPGLITLVDKINKECSFSEFIITLSSGIYLQQSMTFNKLSVDVARETFKNLGSIAQIINEAF